MRTSRERDPTPGSSATYRREFETAAAVLVRDIKSTLVAWAWAILGGAAAIFWLAVTQGNWRLRVLVGIGLVVIATLLGQLAERLQNRNETN